MCSAFSALSLALNMSVDLLGDTLSLHLPVLPYFLLSESQVDCASLGCILVMCFQRFCSHICEPGANICLCSLFDLLFLNFYHVMLPNGWWLLL